MDYSLQQHKQFVGKQASEVPSPAFIISLPIVKANIAALHKDVEELGIMFRPHVKTLKVTWPSSIGQPSYLRLTSGPRPSR